MSSEEIIEQGYVDQYVSPDYGDEGWENSDDDSEIIINDYTAKHDADHHTLIESHPDQIIEATVKALRPLVGFYLSFFQDERLKARVVYAYPTTNPSAIYKILHIVEYPAGSRRFYNCFTPAAKQAYLDHMFINKKEIDHIINKGPTGTINYFHYTNRSNQKFLLTKFLSLEVRKAIISLPDHLKQQSDDLIPFKDDMDPLPDLENVTFINSLTDDISYLIDAIPDCKDEFLQMMQGKDMANRKLSIQNSKREKRTHADREEHVDTPRPPKRKKVQSQEVEHIPPPPPLTGEWYYNFNPDKVGTYAPLITQYNIPHTSNLTGCTCGEKIIKESETEKTICGVQFQAKAQNALMQGRMDDPLCRGFVCPAQKGLHQFCLKCMISYLQRVLMAEDATFPIFCPGSEYTCSLPLSRTYVSTLYDIGADISYVKRADVEISMARWDDLCFRDYFRNRSLTNLHLYAFDCPYPSCKYLNIIDRTDHGADRILACRKCSNDTTENTTFCSGCKLLGIDLDENTTGDHLIKCPKKWWHYRYIPDVEILSAVMYSSTLPSEEIIFGLSYLLTRIFEDCAYQTCPCCLRRKRLDPKTSTSTLVSNCPCHVHWCYLCERMLPTPLQKKNAEKYMKDPHLAPMKAGTHFYSKNVNSTNSYLVGSSEMCPDDLTELHNYNSFFPSDGVRALQALHRMKFEKAFSNLHYLLKDKEALGMALALCDKVVQNAFQNVFKIKLRINTN